MTTRAMWRMAVLAAAVAHAGPVIDKEALAKLVEAGRAASSDAVVVLVDGKVVAEEYYGKPKGPIEAMSATKSIVGLAIGLLLDEGRVSSLEQLAADFFSAWRQGKKQLVAVRHLLTHASGVELLMGALGGEAGPELRRFQKEVLGRGFLPAPLSGPTGYEAQGYLGQFLVVYPAKKLVAVRMYRGPSDESAPTEASGFADFEAAVYAVVR